MGGERERGVWVIIKAREGYGRMGVGIQSNAIKIGYWVLVKKKERDYPLDNEVSE